MNFDKYKMNKPYPKSSDFRVIKEVTFETQTKEVIFDNTEAYKEACKIWIAESKEKNDMFIHDFYEELGISDHPKRKMLYEKAWEHGHASGYSDVMNWGHELVDLIL